MQFPPPGVGVGVGDPPGVGVGVGEPPGVGVGVGVPVGVGVGVGVGEGVTSSIVPTPEVLHVALGLPTHNVAFAPAAVLSATLKVSAPSDILSTKVGKLIVAEVFPGVIDTVQNPGLVVALTDTPVPETVH